MDVGFIVINRKGVKRDETKNWYLSNPHLYIQDDGDIPVSDHSSTEVKKLWKRCIETGDIDVLNKMVPEKVFNYISKNGLYVD